MCPVQKKSSQLDCPKNEGISEKSTSWKNIWRDIYEQFYYKDGRYAQKKRAKKFIIGIRVRKLYNFPAISSGKK